MDKLVIVDFLMQFDPHVQGENSKKQLLHPENKIVLALKVNQKFLAKLSSL